jgi:hypothetical protein
VEERQCSSAAICLGGRHYPVRAERSKEACEQCRCDAETQPGRGTVLRYQAHGGFLGSGQGECASDYGRRTRVASSDYSGTVAKVAQALCWAIALRGPGRRADPAGRQPVRFDRGPRNARRTPTWPYRCEPGFRSDAKRPREASRSHTAHRRALGQISCGTSLGDGTSLGEGTGLPSGLIPGGPAGGMFSGSLIPGIPAGMVGSGAAGVGRGSAGEGVSDMLVTISTLR